MKSDPADKPTNRFLKTTLPRLTIALLVAIALSVPLLLILYAGEITEILNDRKSLQLAVIEEQYNLQIQQKEVEIEQLQKETEAQFQLREKAYQAYKCECDGTCGTGKVGHGSDCARKEAQYLQADREYQEAKAHNEAQIAAHQEAIKGLRLAADRDRQESEAAFPTGLRARLSTIRQLPPGPRIMIPLVLFLLGGLPVIAKRRADQ
jgi:hypothetical protein